jgi:DNA-binding transcriptional ArsR family regulator
MPLPPGARQLVQRRRARALRAIGDGATTTTGLAQRLGVTPPTASEHAAALRNAGLITTRRSGRKVHHQLTAIGANLVAANQIGASKELPGQDRQYRPYAGLGSSERFCSVLGSASPGGATRRPRAQQARRHVLSGATGDTQ